MYNLIVGVLAGIVLGTLSVAGVWYGGAVYEQARLRAELVAVQGQQQQIAAAVDLYETERAVASRRSVRMALRSPGSSKTVF